MSRIGRRWWVGLGVAVVASAGVGVYLLRSPKPAPDPPARTPELPDDPVPVRADPDGWRLTHDCSLVMDPPPFVRTSPVGKFIFTPAVGLVPTNRGGWTHRIRPVGETEVRLLYNPIPLRLSRTVEQPDGRVYLTENNESGVPVTTMVIKEGTRIMPEQPAEVVDRTGKVVLRYPSG
ncbi:MAG TPA: hypothetical protein VKE74_13445 [Gemmataceae bacterium]|nr:hypothetical protein [Gemmataceae bacterium]